MTTLLKRVERERHNVVADSFTPTWNELLGQYKSQQVRIDPDYQRGFRWAAEQQTEYIESLLLNIPTPPLFMSELKDGTFEVIDGLQRFSTIIRFFSAEIFDGATEISAIHGEEWFHSEETVNNLRIPSVLTSAPILPDLDGHSAETLPELLVRTIRYARINVILLKRESSEVARFNVFMRLNRAGSTLSAQEMRNCSARLTDSTFANWLKGIANTDSVLKAMSLSANDKKEMRGQENVLRLLAFSLTTPPTNRIDAFLDKFMYSAAVGEIVIDDKIKKRVADTFALIYAAYPKGEAFRFLKEGKFSGAFSSNLFDIIGCGVYKNILSLKKSGHEYLRKRIEALHKSPLMEDLVGAGSNTRKKMMGRVALGAKWFKA